MSLDQNLFTLSLQPNKSDPLVVDLVDPTGTTHYRKRRIPGATYQAEVYDPTSESLLVIASGESVISKTKTLELHNPTHLVELKYTGKLSFRWSFKWETHAFEWKREECFMVRKPDPPVLVALTKEAPGRLKTTSVQILDYNLNRFDIEDRKGLEIVILTALLSFQDYNEALHERKGSGSSSPSPATPTPSRTSSSNTVATSRSLLPKSIPSSGLNKIAEAQASKGEPNEIVIEEEGAVEDYATYCTNLLIDDSLLFVTIRSAAAAQVPKVLQVVERAKRIRDRLGLGSASELQQYVQYDADAADKAKKGSSKLIKFDEFDILKRKNKSSRSVLVYLSKIPMPELEATSSTPESRGK